MKLFAPGPIRIPNVVKASFFEDPPYFTSREFSSIMKHNKKMLQECMNSECVLVGTGSGSLGLEMTVRNLFNQNDVVLCIITGKYGDTWAQMAMQNGAGVLQIRSELGECVSADYFAEWIEGYVKQDNSVIDGLLVTHVETTTAVVNPIHAYQRIFQQYYPESLVCVDAVSSFLTEDLDCSKFDAVVTASQKGLQCAPGLFMISLSSRAINRHTPGRPVYFDFLKEAEYQDAGKTVFTPASSLYLALNVCLESVIDIGDKEVIANCRAMAKRVRSTFKERGFSLFSKSPCNAVTAVEIENANKFIEEVRKRGGVVLGAGVRDLSNKIFRIAHFGWDTEISEVDGVVDLIMLISGMK
jgi:aspartate aminotransferase-like enzyme